MFRKADLHVHTTMSDGELTPTEVIKYACEMKVDIISITDHNTTLGVEEAIIEGNKHSIRVIPGIELSTRFKGHRVHILGYFKDDRYKEEKLSKALCYIKKKKDKELKKLFKNEFEIEVKKGKVSLKSGMKILKYFGAKVVLAHPVLIEKEYTREIIDLPFDGIEAKYYRNTSRDTKIYINLAKKKNLFYTAGSDFHTNKTEDFNHGLIGEVYLDSKEIERFLKRSKLEKSPYIDKRKRS
ncbi:PHP domain-containing protein [Clostridium cylindrosporum]|nr:PHP domain-containing protein [Clostridium cylindrosporum]